MKFIKKWNEISLIKRIIGGMVIGACLGLLVPKFTAIGILGDLFVGALKAIAPILVFILVMNSLAQAKAGHNGNMANVLSLYAIGTLGSALIAVVANFLFPVSIMLTTEVVDTSSAPSGIVEVLKTLLLNAVDNPIHALISANYIGVLVWACIFGIALKHANKETKIVINNLSDATSMVVRWVISCAPFGILGLVFTTVSANGLDVFTTYGKLIGLLVGCMLVVVLVYNPLVVFLCIKQNPYPLVLKCLKESAITAFFTRSSAANIPVNMELCKELGLDEDNYSVSIPLGATINMAGAAIVITTMTLSATHVLGIAVDFPAAVVLCILSAVAAAGTSGVAGGSLMLIPLACSLFGISNDIAMQVVAVGFIISFIQDSCETALNSSTDVLFTATAEFRLWKKAGKEIVINKKA
ncbi:serine/threonine transporter SstT [Anaerosacchariphilus polymeriproducens]|uniref:Serine/threonine transporter SstT n=1 Tax=Anaerosacchariphilus polymeriproducens TaxID=1812858 RepID=A0A371AZK2_9FIRM|nr:serine/threonine transporter SstT [Anaerosacchariphilus polymeriproducens]RDU24991.1 serine/threonine transporter SstT [Anaerosacchariphilus polymeriproducens]